MMNGSGMRAVLGATICALLAACSSKADRIDASLKKGAQFVQQAEWDKAGIEARNVLQMDPKNAAGYLLAGKVEDGRGAFRNAYANYRKALELRPASIDARLGVARLYLLSGELSEASTAIDGVLGVDSGNSRAQALHATLLARQGHPEQALGEADRLMRAGTVLTADSSMALAGLYFNAHKLDTALSLLDQAIAANPRDASTLQMAAEIAETATDDPAMSTRAVGYYRRATEVAPKSTAVWKRWALMHIRRQAFDEAEGVLRRSIQAQPDDVQRTLALLDFTAAFRDKAQAEKGYASAVEAHPKEAELRFAQADFFTREHRPEDAAKVLQAVIDQGKDSAGVATARGRLAAIRLDAGQPDQAKALLAELLKSNPRDGAGLLLRGRMELAEGNARDAVIDLRAAAKDRPDAPEVVALLARAHRLAGEPQLAREVLAEAVKFNGDSAPLRLLLAADMAQAREYKAALPEIDAAIKQAPQDPRGQEMKIEVALSMGDLSAAEAAARAFELQFPASPAGHLMHGKVLARQKNTTAALAQFDAAAKLAPRLPDPVIAAVGLQIATRQFREAGARIAALLAANPQSALAQQLRGELALAQGDAALAERSFHALIDLPAAPPSAYKNLAAVMVARKNLDGAMAVLDRGEKAWPKDTSLAASRAEWLGRAGRTDDAIATYEAALRRAPDSEVVANNLAYVLAQSKRDRTSLDRALVLANRFALSNQPSYMDTLGLVRYRLGLYDQAAIVLERAIAMAPAEPVLQLHYGMALVKKGDVQRGSEILRKVLASKAALPDGDEARALLARV